MMITVREIEERDFEEVATLTGQLNYEVNAEETLLRIKAIKSSAVDSAFVATHNELVVGWIHNFYTMRIESKPFVEIAGLVVNSEYRNQNIGKLLIEKATEWAKGYQVTSVRVRCNTMRKDSHKFYQHIGFRLTKQQMIFEIVV
ncbi:GNAT family N-acetyltransferase [Pedobacter fastidiosus]|uniref:GNAT family N-acetyltransferase n=1 Tax=Pedobacter fastidiosus TaxID=2765361 RepID=A0ABR7KUB5_9SPHI|nr:GNAT family N-acetyltransferase [Pedobacter fastidiosus]MBC6111708.1 GNAT family N-acetyltransferase [Pedobacter fastidiosus]